jgi:hypothetical protein
MSFFFNTKIETEREEYDRLLKEKININKRKEEIMENLRKDHNDKEARKKYLEQKFNPTKTSPTFNDREKDIKGIKERIATSRENEILKIIKLKQQYPAISLERAILQTQGWTNSYYKDKRIIDLFNLEETVLSSSSKSSSSSKKEQSPPKFLDGSRGIQKQLLDNLTDSKNELRKPKSPPPFPKRSTIQQPKPSKRITGQLLTDSKNELRKPKPKSPPPFPKRSTIQQPKPSKRITGQLLTDSKNKLKHKSKSPKKLNPIDPNYTIEMMFRDMNKPS